MLEALSISKNKPKNFMSADKRYYVYILASGSAVLYIGVTNGLARRIRQHKEKLVPGVTQKYDVDRLVHYEWFENVRSAITREKRIKSWRREKKIALIEATNPRWIDLNAEWLDPARSAEVQP